jgi:hypothetical protein
MVLNILFTSLKKKTNSLFTILDQVPDLLVLKLSAPTTHALLLKKEEGSQGREVKNASEVCTEVGTTKEKESFRASRSSITWNCLPVLFFLDLVCVFQASPCKLPLSSNSECLLPCGMWISTSYQVYILPVV